MKKIFIHLFIVLLFFLMSSAAIVSAQSNSTPPKDRGPLQELKDIQPDSGYSEYSDETSLPSIVGIVINAFLSLLGIIFIGLMLYAGFEWMTARGDEPKMEKARDTLTRAIIGLIITVSSFAIWKFVFDYFISK